MKTKPINYDKLYSISRKMFYEDSSYSIDRKTEALAYILALETGLRVSDLLNLKYSDIEYNAELKKHVFTCYVSKVKKEHKGVVSAEAYNYIELYKNIIKTCYNGFSDVHVFYNYKTNKLYSRQWLHKRIKLISEMLGLDNIGMHSIRKSSAINVLDKTGSLSMAQYHLTHSRATTTDNYLKVTEKSALEKLASIF